MADWYRHNKSSQDETTKKVVYNSYIPPTVDKTPEDIYIISRIGDRLENLAQKYYQDPSKWRIIGNANNLGKGTTAIPVGTQLRIPIDPDVVLDELKKQNEER